MNLETVSGKRGSLLSEVKKHLSPCGQYFPGLKGRTPAIEQRDEKEEADEIRVGQCDFGR